MNLNANKLLHSEKSLATLTIAEADGSDLDEILGLQKLAYESEARLYNDWSLPALTQTIDSFRDESSNNIILKGILEGRIVGSVRAKVFDKTCEIGRLIVHPEMQGKRYGSKQLKAIEEKHAHLKRYELFTGSISEANIRLYERHGYKITHTKPLSKSISITYLEKHV